MYDTLSDKQQKLMCTLCEEEILGCKHSTATFICEGSHCDEAFDLLSASIDLNDEETR